LLLVLILFAMQPCFGTVINFDDIVVQNNTQAGNTYSAQGIEFTTYDDIASTVAVGDTIALTGGLNTFWLIVNGNAVSGTSFAAATDGGDREVLMSFSSPINSLLLHTDDTVESGQTVRLLALLSTGLDTQFEVLALDEGLDDATTSPDNELFVSGVSFSYALFQTVGEQEGFDDVTFELTAVPEPHTIGLTLLGLGAMVMLRSRSRGRQR
jgi:hypothetical protein